MGLSTQGRDSAVQVRAHHSLACEAAPSPRSTDHQRLPCLFSRWIGKAYSSFDPFPHASHTIVAYEIVVARPLPHPSQCAALLRPLHFDAASCRLVVVVSSLSVASHALPSTEAPNYHRRQHCALPTAKSSRRRRRPPWWRERDGGSS